MSRHLPLNWDLTGKELSRLREMMQEQGDGLHHAISEEGILEDGAVMDGEGVPPEKVSDDS
jgi:hypothetical protein